jgi:mRNA interferase MazF
LETATPGDHRRPGDGDPQRLLLQVLIEADGSPVETDSSVRLDQVRVVLIEQRSNSVTGRLDAETMTAVDEALRLSLGLD